MSIREPPLHKCRMSAADVCATILEIVGIDPDMSVYDHNDRPVRAANGGAPIEAILA